MTKKIGIILVTVALFGAFLIWLFVESSKPLHGTKIEDLGRGHVKSGENVDYNSNPPTSGKHYAEWVRPGIYNEPKDDRNLVHSLEHGYIIMYYKCPTLVIPSGPARSADGSPVETQSEESQNSSRDSSPESTLSAANVAQNDISEECKTRRDQLAKIYEKKGQKKIIVVPRPNLETNFALTAWNYLDKFNEFDQNRIEKFIDAHINQGPEKTME